MAENNNNNLFSGAFEDRVDDVIVTTMNAMDDTALLNFCSTNKYYRNICEKVILPHRIKNTPGLALLLRYRDKYKSLQHFYFNIRNDTQYVLMELGDVEWRINAISHDITIVHKKYYETWEFRTSLNDRMTMLDMVIAIRFNNLDDYKSMEDYIIFSDDPKFSHCNNVDILKYPLLTYKSIYATISYNTDLLGPHYAYIGSLLCSMAHNNDNYEQQVKNLEGPTRVIPRYTDKPGESPAECDFITHHKFINFDTVALRAAHNEEKDINIYYNGAGAAGEQFSLQWMQFGYEVYEAMEPGQHLNIFLLDFAAIELEPATYNFVIFQDNDKLNEPNTSLSNLLGLSYNNFIRELKENIQRLIMKSTTKIYGLVDMLYVLFNYEDPIPPPKMNDN